MKRSVAKAVIVLLLAGFWMLPAYTAITVQLDSLGAFQYECPKSTFQGVEKFTEVNTLDIQRFPHLRVRLKAFREGYEIPIEQQQVLIVQENIVYVPERFERMPDGWYERGRIPDGVLPEYQHFPSSTPVSAWLYADQGIFCREWKTG